MKRALKSVFLAALGLALAFSLYSCNSGGGNASNCDHAARETRVETDINATCTESGVADEVVYCLNCTEILDRKRVTIQPLGHLIDYHEAMAPGCEEDGYNEYETCQRCDYKRMRR